MLTLPYSIERPARYIGKEPLSVKKDPQSVKVRFALCYPDIYDAGMSYYGLFLLYELINSLDFVFCERAFAPWFDMEAYMLERGIELFTLETRTPLRFMHMVGFSLTYELNLTNVLNMLRLSSIPRRREERTSGPLVVGGGPLCMNPKPFERFFDLLVIGEAEEVLVRLLKVFKDLVGERKERILSELEKLEGVYVPGMARTVKRVYVSGLDCAPHSVKPPIPVADSIHNRLNIEVSRGCPNGCRFCLAGFIYRPYRERSPERLKEIMAEALRNTGYEEISLLSLSAGDYSGLEEILSHVRCHYRGLSVSLPSIRTGTLQEKGVVLLGEISRTGLTFAIESASERLRMRLNKRVDFEALFGTLPVLRKLGWRKIKLYVMIGFPWEEEEDIRQVSGVVKAFLKAGMDLTLSVSTFVPKPHTPFQWLPMEEPGRILEKLSILRECAKPSQVKLGSIERAMVECIIGRGDERIAQVLELVHERGGRLEAWREFFDPKRYFQALEELGLDGKVYTGRIALDSLLPWDVVDTGIDKAFLRAELDRAEKGEWTRDCKTSCVACGLGCRKSCSPAEARPIVAIGEREEKEKKRVERVFIRYKKAKEARYIGHMDTVSILLRGLRACGIVPITHGRYHPLPKVSFSKALPLFAESRLEWMELDKEAGQTAEDLKERLNAFLPEGLEVLEIREASGTREESEVFLFVTENKLDKEPSLVRGSRYFYLLHRGEAKQVLKKGTLGRLIKVREERIRWPRNSSST